MLLPVHPFCMITEYHNNTALCYYITRYTGKAEEEHLVGKEGTWPLKWGSCILAMLLTFLEFSHSSKIWHPPQRPAYCT